MSRPATQLFSHAPYGYETVNTRGMRRSLVLSDETARHPFLASLPPHVRRVRHDNEPCDPDEDLSWWKLTRDDIRGFVSTYLATFLAALVFIL